MNKTVHYIGWAVHKETMADAAPSLGRKRKPQRRLQVSSTGLG